MKKIDYFICFSLSLIALLTRLPLIEKMQSHWDGGEYSIAVVQYAMQYDTPAPPGYPIYIAFGKLFHLFFSDPHLSIVLVSVLFSIIGPTVFYLFGKRLFNKPTGIIAALLFLSSPTLFYFGITANPYGILPTTAVILVWVVYEIIAKNKKFGALLGIIFAFCIGLRPQDTFFLAPLFIYGLIKTDKKNKILGLVACFIGVLCWLIPLLYSVGGINNYLELLQRYQVDALPGPSLLYPFSVWFILVRGLFMTLGISSLMLVVYLFLGKNWFRKKNWLKKVFTNHYVVLFSLWIFPSLLFNMFVRSNHAAHQMAYLSGLLMLVAYATWRIFSKRKMLLWIMVVVFIISNLYTFFRDRDPGNHRPYTPQSLHYSEIRKNDLRLQSKVLFIQQKFNPKTTWLISSEPYWSQYSYYLPSYQATALFRLNNTNIASDRYLHFKIDSVDWKLHWSNVKNYELTIPKQIKTVIFTDDEAPTWIKNYPFKKYDLAANSSITTVTVSSDQKIIYDYRTIRIISVK